MSGSYRETRYCSHCGARNPAEARYCDRCGREVAGRARLDAVDQQETATLPMTFRSGIGP